MCAGFAGRQCQPGLFCKVKSEPFVNDAAGICIRKANDPCKGTSQPDRQDLAGSEASLCRCATKCSKDSQPVCAMDLQTMKNSTYTNPCHAQCGGAYILYRGACPAEYPLPPNPCRCSSTYIPVCATDPDTAITTTYTNACIAGCSKYPLVNKGVCTNQSGAYLGGGGTATPCFCGDIREPTCGVPDKKGSKMTYGSLCTAVCSGATGTTPGRCQQ